MLSAKGYEIFDRFLGKVYFILQQLMDKVLKPEQGSLKRTVDRFLADKKPFSTGKSDGQNFVI